MRQNNKSPNASLLAKMTLSALIAATTIAPTTLLQEAFADTDKFGIEKIYQTGGRTWFMDRSNVDSLFNSEFKLLTDDKVKKKENGIFHVDTTDDPKSHGVRFHVTTPEDKKEWKNVEMTGYFKLLDQSRDQYISLIARGGHHSDETRCDATGYFAKLGFDGDVRFQKKISHGNYANSVGKVNNVVDDLEDEGWVGMKFIVYNINHNHDAKLELYIDDSNEGNNWKKVSQYVDDGGWEAEDGRTCGKDDDEILNDSREWVSFRTDSSEILFKNLSVREIDP
jgi:hypothetical protein